MKPFNSLLHNDIIKLKELRELKKSDPKYMQLFKNILGKHNISRSTVYAELAKDTPGIYKKTDRKGWMVKISSREMDLVAGLVASGKAASAICKAMSVEMGFSYSPNRLIRAKKKYSDKAREITNNEPKIIKHNLSPVGANMKTNTQTNETPQSNAAAFESSPRKFFYELSGLDLKDMKSIISLNFYGSEYNVSARVIKECLDHITASAVSGGKNICELTKFDIETLLIQQLRYAKLNEYISPAELRQLSSIHRTLLEYEKSSASGGYSLDDVHSVVQFFSPDATREEVAKVLGA